MAYERAASIAVSRRAVHSTMGVAATYEDPSSPGVVGLRVRWHNRLALQGDLVEAGYANVVDGVNRVVFDKAELDEKGVVLSRGAELTMPDGTVLILDHQEPVVGPVTVIWGVAHK